MVFCPAVFCPADGRGLMPSGDASLPSERRRTPPHAAPDGRRARLTTPGSRLRMEKVISASYHQASFRCRLPTGTKSGGETDVYHADLGLPPPGNVK